MMMTTAPTSQTILFITISLSVLPTQQMRRYYVPCHLPALSRRQRVEKALSPPAKSIISTASEEEKDDKDNQDGAHSFLRVRCWGISLLHMRCGYIRHQIRKLLRQTHFWSRKAYWENSSSCEKVANCSERSNPVAEDLGSGQHWHGEDRAGNTPHPEPEDERQNDEHGIEGEPSRQQDRCYRLALDQMNSKIEPRRKEREPERVNCQQAREEKDRYA